METTMQSVHHPSRLHPATIFPWLLTLHAILGIGEGTLAPRSSMVTSHMKMVDLGDGVTLECLPRGVQLPRGGQLVWVKEGKDLPRHSRILDSGDLWLNTTDPPDAGNYSCELDSAVDSRTISRTLLIVRSHPPAVVNLNVRPSSALATVTWSTEGNGNSPLLGFRIRYRPLPRPLEVLDEYDPDLWKSPSVLQHIPPLLRQVEVYHLEPNTTYLLQVEAWNRLGRSLPAEVQFTTHDDVAEIELENYILETGRLKVGNIAWGVAAALAALVFLFFTLFLIFLSKYLVHVWRVRRSAKHRAGIIERMGGLGTKGRKRPQNLAQTGIICNMSQCPPKQWTMKKMQAEIEMPVDTSETIELIPNIIVNPGFGGDENSNTQQAQLVNNNSIVRPESC
ncbi:unnamed protein product [Darwinula stevensoni]|uniref:Uncharacterized protein n=1 Tax=Darwinula stevensoni TaxID=69355 RepID=A0A7R9A4D6_9CRUS|nr:unnamed protein product [Darwinula stevensoni]CAG0883159.1 unnamed protein product [Darwinula stevensoni]